MALTRSSGEPERVTGQEERGIAAAAGTFAGSVNDWEARLAPLLAEGLRKRRADMAGRCWHATETCCRRGRKAKVGMREVLNALRYLVPTGCGCRMLPVHFPSWQSVYW
jgi:hypothetical protein